jgi:predicted MFS family arabinose efflux permease
MASLGVLVWLLIPAVLLWVKPAPGSPAALKAERRRSGAQEAPAESPALPGMTLQEALRVPTFWLIAISLFANGLIMNLVFIHLPNYMLSQGYSEALAATGLSILGGVGILGTIVTGTLSDRLGRRNVLLLMFGARGFTALLVILIPGPLAMLAFVAVFGILGYGAIGVFGSLATELFGKRAIGSILGSAYVFNQVGGAAGVYIGGASFEVTGSYSTSLWVSIIVTLLSIVCVALTAPEPRRAAPAA